MLGSQTALRIAPRHEEHPVAHQRPALTMHRRDMHEQLFAALLRTNEAEALVVVPAFSVPRRSMPEPENAKRAC